mmetsp:Transcript_34891/g.80829  ORF Transcript_34891/g.80829 Transcript_34891/m.80829 type:complete len:245 (-) Transcript_34891:212-946(-)
MSYAWQHNNIGGGDGGGGQTWTAGASSTEASEHQRTFIPAAAMAARVNPTKARLADVGRTIFNSKVVLITNLTSTNTGSTIRIRAALAKEDIGLKFVKNNIANVALQELPKRKVLGNLLKGHNAIIYSDHESPVAAFKAVQAVEKEFPNVMVLGGAFGDSLLSREGIKEAIKLPDMEELNVELISAMLAPAASLAGTLKSAHGAAGLVRALEQTPREATAALSAGAGKGLAGALAAHAHKLENP